MTTGTVTCRLCEFHIRQTTERKGKYRQHVEIIDWNPGLNGMEFLRSLGEGIRGITYVERVFNGTYEHEVVVTTTKDVDPIGTTLLLIEAAGRAIDKMSPEKRDALKTTSTDVNTALAEYSETRGW